ncbi:hypothetical protein LTR70_009669 [Exophiala xenobiotica]|nr:hypothetical protein LTR70_009669 [Exophiala xenobiotica]
MFRDRVSWFILMVVHHDEDHLVLGSREYAGGTDNRKLDLVVMSAAVLGWLTAPPSTTVAVSMDSAGCRPDAVRTHGSGSGKEKSSKPI